MCCLRSNKGFTLIELLITISIIAILSAIGIVTYSSVLKQGRDSKRQSDLRSIQSALEQYYSDQMAYPSALPSPGNALTGGVKTYLNAVPDDSDSSKKYYYNPSPAPYVLCAQLDVAPNPASNCGANACGTGYNCNFKVSPP